MNPLCADRAPRGTGKSPTGHLGFVTSCGVGCVYAIAANGNGWMEDECGHPGLVVHWNNPDAQLWSCRVTVTKAEWDRVDTARTDHVCITLLGHCAWRDVEILLL